MGITHFDVVQANAFIGGLLGFPTQGNVWFVRPAHGSDGNSGRSPAEAFATVSKALSVATANQNDVIYLMAESNTAASTTDYQATTLVWNKDLVHLVGVGAPSRVSQRARLAALSTATGVSPVLQVTANGCIFANLSVFGGISGDATSLGAVEVTGSRNYFYNVHIAGMGTTDAVTAGGYSLKLNAAAENVFEKCVLGLDTIARDNSTQGELWLAGAATRNEFQDCLFQGFISNAGYLHVTFTGSTAIDRWVNFEGCSFFSESANDAVAQTQIFGSMDALTQGYINLKNCAAFTPGATAAVWVDTGTNRLKVAMPAPTKVGGAGVIVN